jgi:tetratricopeptide (TPR) repeat protein
MSENDLVETKPNPVNRDNSAGVRKKFPGWLVASVLIVLVIVGALAGYGSGMGKRYSAQNTLVTGQLDDQFKLGVQAVDAGQFELAKQHFEFILQRNPNFPGVRDAYANLLLHMQQTPTPTITPTPTVTPTPDARSADIIYADALALLKATDKDLCARDWNGLITLLDSLRKKDASYQTADVDGMYYIALHNRGICKIYPQTYEPNTYCADLNINLEGGIYDLTMAERFGPLDAGADALRTWARMYIAGASFWDQDWTQVKDLFSQVRAAYPNLSDSSCVSATDRWRQASIEYALQLMNKGDACGAKQQFNDAFSIDSSKNQEYYPTATAVQNICSPVKKGPTKTPKSPSKPTAEPTAAETAVPPSEPTAIPTATK